MHTARVTILMPPERKAGFDALAADRGISTGEFFRRAGEREAVQQADTETELAGVVQELAQALPEMQADIQAMRQAIADAREAIRSYRTEKSAEANVAA